MGEGPHTEVTAQSGSEADLTFGPWLLGFFSNEGPVAWVRVPALRPRFSQPEQPAAGEQRKELPPVASRWETQKQGFLV
ncbi:hypothetical protein Y1Q_0006424 [Alligator mississippiensis]|uniref:Uncharacterized protein n=1 Tax=Alligator mississippiensis TaxID=8496 RepID=A0A151NY57_ALLMI|nr:hypothetical protein Y1Q_0006424 [Alligator mississippiensis]